MAEIFPNEGLDYMLGWLIASGGACIGLLWLNSGVVR